MDRNEPEQAKLSVSRRDALKKGALIGGAILWVTPVVQTIAMTSASAQTTSGTGGHQPSSSRGSAGGGAPAGSVGGTASAGGNSVGDVVTGTAADMLAGTGVNAEQVAEVGLAATALGITLTALSRVRESHGGENDGDGEELV